MRNIINRKSCLCVLFFSFVLCMLVGITTFKVHASTSISSFNIPGGQVKFAVDPAYNGVRFPTLMSESEYETNKGSITTGIILCDADNLGQNGQLTHSTTGMIDIDTTDLWKESNTVDGYMEAAAFVYGIPDTTEAYLNKIAAVGYYKFDAGEPVYTKVLVRSAAEIANSAYNDRRENPDGQYVHYVEADGNYSRFDETQLNGILSYLPNFTVTYMADGNEIDSRTVRYGQKAESLTVEDKTGYEFNSWQVNGVDYNFESGVTGNLTLTANYIEKTYVCGTGFDVTIGVPACATLCENEITEGENAGKWYKSITKTSGSDASSFTVTATEEAGLESNTVYLVSVVVDTDGAHPAYYREATDATVKYGERFYLSAGKQNVVFYITTDENGEFTKAFNNCYWNSGTYVNFSGLTVMKAAYDKGLQIVNYTGSQTNIVEGIVDSGNDTAITQLTRKQGNGNTNLYINATTDAGLKASTTYNVTVTVNTNGKYYHEASPALWVINTSNNKINFEITTDANGEFSQYYLTQFTEGSFAKFTDVEVIEVVEEKKSAYQDGVTLSFVPDTASSMTLSEVDIGNGVYAQKVTRNTSGATCGVYITATSEVGLKASTSYDIYIDVTTNGTTNTFYHYVASPSFIIGGTGRYKIGTVTTDANGVLSWEKKCVVAKGGNALADTTDPTYVIFNAIDFVEVVG